MLDIKNVSNTLVITFKESDWDRHNQLTFCRSKFSIPEFCPPTKKGYCKTLLMKINGKDAQVIVTEDNPMGAIRARLSMSGYTDMRQAHLYILNTDDFPEIIGHMYLSYYIRRNSTKELIFLLLTQRKVVD